ncbi:heparan-alpha-glucosaminide N-acetyltransferase domain-containing protein [Botrimarina sp.]|uniref:acyltransferase family protein n=1 Tax=Botrimarina sp. TaxID=2795802 RepID=UPI0032F080F4
MTTVHPTPAPAEASSPAGGQAAHRGRLLSLDVMRGLTILAMILVNNPGDWGQMYWPLGHADWHGLTPTDLIFPFFLFMVGVAMAYSFAKYTGERGRPTPAVWRRIARRVFSLIALGLLLNASGRLISVPLGYSDSWDWATLRWPGVLQRIGLAYLFGSVIVLTLGARGQAVAAVGLLVLYSLLLDFAPPDVPPAERMTPTGNIVRVVDVAVIGEPHMWTQATSHPTDPEGLLSTLPSIVTVLIGYAVGRRLRGADAAGGRTLIGLLAVGGLLAAAGWLWHNGPHPGWGQYVNKALWTPSFVLVSGGLGMVCLAACLAVFDRYGRESPRVRRVATAFEVVGVNAIFVFVASGFVARALTVFRVSDRTLKDWIYTNGFVEPLHTVGLNDPRLASVAYACWFVACWWLLLAWMWSRGWTIRV